MQKKKYIDALVVEDRTNVMQQHSITEKDSRSSLFWLEILMHFDKVYNDVQLVCPGKLVYKKVRLHGSRWQKAHRCFHMDALQRQRYHLILNALQRQRNQMSIRVLFHVILYRLIWHVRKA